MPKIIGVDVDGVLANFFEAYERLHIQVAGEDKFGDKKWPAQRPQYWHWPAEFGYTREHTSEVWKRIKQDPLFWAMLKPLPGAEEFLNALANSEHEVYFITDRPGNNPQHQTIDWLYEYGYSHPSVIISRHGKAICCDAVGTDLYIDDKPENVEEVAEAGRDVYILDQPYNRSCESGIRVANLAEFLEVVNG